MESTTRTAVFREARTECMRDFLVGAKNKKHPRPLPSTKAAQMTKYFCWDVLNGRQKWSPTPDYEHIHFLEVCKTKDIQTANPRRSSTSPHGVIASPNLPDKKLKEELKNVEESVISDMILEKKRKIPEKCVPKILETTDKVYNDKRRIPEMIIQKNNSDKNKQQIPDKTSDKILEKEQKKSEKRFQKKFEISDLVLNDERKIPEKIIAKKKLNKSKRQIPDKPRIPKIPPIPDPKKIATTENAASGKSPTPGQNLLLDLYSSSAVWNKQSVRQSTSVSVRRFLSRSSAKTDTASVVSLACNAISRLERRLERLCDALQEVARLREKEAELQKELLSVKAETTTTTHWTGLEIHHRDEGIFVRMDQNDVVDQISMLTEFYLSPKEPIADPMRECVRDAVATLVNAIAIKNTEDELEAHRSKRQQVKKNSKSRKRKKSSRSNLAVLTVKSAKICEEEEEGSPTQPTPPPSSSRSDSCDTWEPPVPIICDTVPPTPYDDDDDNDEPGQLVIDDEDADVDVENEDLFSPVIVSTRSLKGQHDEPKADEDENNENDDNAEDMSELRNLRRKYHNPVRSLCVKFEEILRQLVEFAGSTFVQRTFKRSASSSSEDLAPSPASSSSSSSGTGFVLRCSDLNLKLAVNGFETLEGFQTQFAKAIDAATSDFNLREILLKQFSRLVAANSEHIGLLEKLINPALFDDSVTRLNFILMSVMECKNTSALVSRLSKLRGNTVDAMMDKILGRRYVSRDHFLEDVEWISLWAEEVHGHRSRAAVDAREMVRVVGKELNTYQHCFF
jgi:hypothetical protein